MWRWPQTNPTPTRLGQHSPSTRRITSSAWQAATTHSHGRWAAVRAAVRALLPSYIPTLTPALAWQVDLASRANEARQELGWKQSGYTLLHSSGAAERAGTVAGVPMVVNLRPNPPLPAAEVSRFYQLLTQVKMAVELPGQPAASGGGGGDGTGDAGDAGDGGVGGSACHRVEVPVEVDEARSGFVAHLVSTVASDSYRLCVTVGGVHVQGSPFALSVAPAEPAASHSSLLALGGADERGVLRADGRFVAGERGYMQLVLRDRYGNTARPDGDEDEGVTSRALQATRIALLPMPAEAQRSATDGERPTRGADEGPPVDPPAGTEVAEEAGKEVAEEAGEVAGEEAADRALAVECRLAPFQAASAASLLGCFLTVRAGTYVARAWVNGQPHDDPQLHLGRQSHRLPPAPGSHAAADHGGAGRLVVVVRPGPLCLKRCLVRGAGVHQAVAGARSCFQIEERDEFGNRRPASDVLDGMDAAERPRWRVAIIPVAALRGTSPRTASSDLPPAHPEGTLYAAVGPADSEGRATVVYTAPAAGRYAVSVELAVPVRDNDDGGGHGRGDGGRADAGDADGSGTAPLCEWRVLPGSPYQLAISPAAIDASLCSAEVEATIMAGEHGFAWVTAVDAAGSPLLSSVLVDGLSASLHADDPAALPADAPRVLSPPEVAMHAEALAIFHDAREWQPTRPLEPPAAACVAFRAHAAMRHLLYLQYRGEDVPGSPFPIEVGAAATHPPMCQLTLRNLTPASVGAPSAPPLPPAALPQEPAALRAPRPLVAGETATAHLVARDRYGNRRACGGDAVRLLARSVLRVVEAAVTDHGDGSYSISIPTRDAGPLELTLCVNGHAVPLEGQPSPSLPTAARLSVPGSRAAWVASHTALRLVVEPHTPSRLSLRPWASRSLSAHWEPSAAPAWPFASAPPSSLFSQYGVGLSLAGGRIDLPPRPRRGELVGPTGTQTSPSSVIGPAVARVQCVGREAAFELCAVDAYGNACTLDRSLIHAELEAEGAPTSTRPAVDVIVDDPSSAAHRAEGRSEAPRWPDKGASQPLVVRFCLHTKGNYTLRVDWARQIEATLPIEAIDAATTQTDG